MHLLHRQFVGADSFTLSTGDVVVHQPRKDRSSIGFRLAESKHARYQKLLSAFNSESAACKQRSARSEHFGIHLFIIAQRQVLADDCGDNTI